MYDVFLHNILCHFHSMQVSQLSTVFILQPPLKNSDDTVIFPSDSGRFNCSLLSADHLYLVEGAIPDFKLPSAAGPLLQSPFGSYPNFKSYHPPYVPHPPFTDSKSGRKIAKKTINVVSLFQDRNRQSSSKSTNNMSHSSNTLTSQQFRPV